MLQQVLRIGFIIIFQNNLMKILRFIFQYWLVILQLLLCVNSYYVSTIDFKLTSSFFNLIFVTIIHIMYLYTLYCSCMTPTTPRNELQQQSSTYCRACHLQIYQRDHHCVFIGQCAAKHNYKHFFSFVFYSYILATGNAYNGYLHWALSEFTTMEMLKFYSGPFLMRLIVFFGSGLWFSLFTGQLLAYQFYMILNGITAREHKKRSEPLKYGFRSTTKSLFNRQKRQQMIKGFRERWAHFFKSRYEFIFCDLEN